MKFKGFAPQVMLYTSGGLTKHTGTLVNLCESCPPDQVTALAIATFLTAAAALEALFMEAASILEPELFTCKKFRHSGATEKFSKLMGY